MLIFKTFSDEHIPLLQHWLNSDHIKPFWQETDDVKKLRTKFLDELPARGVFAFAIVKDHQPIGYIQYYDAKKVGDGWWESESTGTFGIDLMIGSVEHHGQGLGPIIIKEFINFVRKRESSLKSIIIDPDPKNHRAVYAFEKAGFVKESEIKTPSGAALLMRMKFDK